MGKTGSESVLEVGRARELGRDAAQRAGRPPRRAAAESGRSASATASRVPSAFFRPLRCPFFALQSRLIRSIFASLLPPGVSLIWGEYTFSYFFLATLISANATGLEGTLSTAPSASLILNQNAEQIDFQSLGRPRATHLAVAETSAREETAVC